MEKRKSVKRKPSANVVFFLSADGLCSFDGKRVKRLSAALPKPARKRK